MFFRKYRTRKYYQKWIDEIANSNTVADLDHHFVKHAQELVNDSRNPASWAASMQNLLNIYIKKEGLDLDYALLIDKLNNHYLNNKNTRVAPPNGKIPKAIQTRSIPKYK